MKSLARMSVFAVAVALGLGCDVTVRESDTPGPVIVDDKPDVIVEDRTPNVTIEDKTPDINITPPAPVPGTPPAKNP
jgi:hypothetical protein